MANRFVRPPRGPLYRTSSWRHIRTTMVSACKFSHAHLFVYSYHVATTYLFFSSTGLLGRTTYRIFCDKHVLDLNSSEHRRIKGSNSLAKKNAESTVQGRRTGHWAEAKQLFASALVAICLDCFPVCLLSGVVDVMFFEYVLHPNSRDANRKGY